MEDFPFTAADIGVVAIVLVSGLLAFARGFVKEMLSVGAWIGAAVVTIYAYPYVEPYMASLISIEIAAKAATAGVVFLITLIVLSTITHWIAGHIRQSHFSAFDRTLGFVFGVVRGAVVVCLAWLLVAWAYDPDRRPEWIEEAQTLPLVQQGANFLVGLVPEDYWERGTAALDDADREAREAISDVAKDAADSQIDAATGTTPEAAPTEGEPAEGEGAEPAAGYDDIQRQEIEDLIETNE